MKQTIAGNGRSIGLSLQFLGFLSYTKERKQNMSTAIQAVLYNMGNLVERKHRFFHD